MLNMRPLRRRAADEAPCRVGLSLIGEMEDEDATDGAALRTGIERVAG